MATILLTEDDQSISKMYQTLLRDKGFTVIPAGDGNECLAACQSQHVDIILLDIMMPNKDGLQTLHELKADPELKNIPVIMLTNEADDVKAKEAIEVGADSYIIKSDENPHDVATMVQGLLHLQDQQHDHNNK